MLLQIPEVLTNEQVAGFTGAGGDVVVSVDKDGGGDAFGFIAMATLTDPTGVTTAQAAVDNGTLVV
jgi:hypothetical protein